jgi:single-stranded DNA-binding protein
VQNVGNYKVVKFDLATNEYSGKNPDTDKAEYKKNGLSYSCEVWINDKTQDLADVCSKFVKGEVVWIEGELLNGEYTNKEGVTVKKNKVQLTFAQTNDFKVHTRDFQGTVFGERTKMVQKDESQSTNEIDSDSLPF